MLNYHDYEKAIFDWLMTKHIVNPNFTFTVRQTAGKGSETDYLLEHQNQIISQLVFGLYLYTLLDLLEIVLA